MPSVIRHAPKVRNVQIRPATHSSKDCYNPPPVWTRKPYSYSSPQVIFSGIQPTGVPHLGNYLGALRQWNHLQTETKSDTKLLFSIVDLHAITVAQDAGTLRKCRRETLATLLAIGLDPDRCIIFFQSSVSVQLICQGGVCC